ncbi:MAG: substrate-binding domain-containing protein, partial [Chloroflexota bacterium]
LIQLGHTRIAFITGARAVRSAADRLGGYKAALADCNIPVSEELVIDGDYQQQTSYESAKRLLQSLDLPATAIFASNDLSAFGAMDAARECGLRIPDDISIIGFDDVPQASYVYPKLTTIRQPLEQMGKVAVKMLLEQIEDPSRPPQRITLATELIIRDSCAMHNPNV